MLGVSLERADEVRRFLEALRLRGRCPGRDVIRRPRRCARLATYVGERRCRLGGVALNGGLEVGGRDVRYPHGRHLLVARHARVHGGLPLGEGGPPLLLR